MINRLKKTAGASLLGLAFDRGRLDGVAVRRTNGSVEIRKSFSVVLSLDPLSHDPELAGREIRKHLEEAGIRERQCAVCVPLSWVLTLQVKLPELPEADIESFLQIEAERGFPYDPATLMISRSRFKTPVGEQFVTLVAVSRDHVARLEAVLKAAQLKPVAFSLGIAALNGNEPGAVESALTMMARDESVDLQVVYDGGVAALRTVEGAFEIEGGEKTFQTEHVARETRVTVAQLPPAVRDSLSRVRVFGQGDPTDQLVEELRPRAEALGLRLEQVRNHAPREFGVQLPPGTPVSPALAVAVRHLTGRGTGLEFLPPRVSAWRQITARYPSQKLAWAGGAAAAIALVVAVALLVQQVMLWRWQSKWNAMKQRVTEVEEFQQRIKAYRPWFDESMRSLSILRRITEAFPEDGAVSAKTVEIREPALVTCSGTARDHQALLKTLDQLRSAKEVSDVKVEQIRGKSPMEFTFNFHWQGAGGR